MQFEHLVVEDVGYICSCAGVIVSEEVSLFGKSVDYHNDGCSWSVIGVFGFWELCE